MRILVSEFTISHDHFPCHSILFTLFKISSDFAEKTNIFADFFSQITENQTIFCYQNFRASPNYLREFQMSKSRIPLRTSDKIIEVISALVLVFIIAYTALHYGSLPDKIPSRFNASGEVTATASPAILFLLIFLSLKIYALLTVINLFPHTFNYPVRVTEENRLQLYTIGTQTNRYCKFLCMLLFAHIHYLVIQNGLGHETGSGLVVSLSLTGLILFVALGSYFRSRQFKN